MDLLEGVGESSSPARSFGGGFGGYDIRNDVYNRLLETGNDEAVCNPELRELLDSHFNRLPARYFSVSACHRFISPSFLSMCGYIKVRL